MTKQVITEVLWAKVTDTEWGDSYFRIRGISILGPGGSWFATIDQYDVKSSTVFEPEWEYSVQTQWQQNDSPVIIPLNDPSAELIDPLSYFGIAPSELISASQVPAYIIEQLDPAQ